MKFNPSDRPVKSLVVIGPPEQPALVTLLENAPEFVVVIEPEHEKAQQLKKAFSGYDNFHIVTAAIGEDGEEAVLVEYNFPGLRSMREPASALKELFPGLSARTTISVNTQSFERVLETLPNIPEPSALFLDMPGSELDILESIESASLLAQVHDLTIKCNAQPMFENGPGAQEVMHWMQDRHYKANQLDDRDPDWPVLQFIPDQTARENQQLKAALTETRADISSLEAELSKEREALAQSLKERAKCSATLKDAQERAAQVPDLVASLAAAKQEAEKAKKDASDSEEALAISKDALKDKVSELQANRAASQASEELLQASLETAVQEAAIASQQVSEKEIALNKSLADLKSVSSELALAKESLSSNEEELRSAPSRINELEAIAKSQAEQISVLEENAKRRTEELERVQEKVASASQREQALERNISETQEELKNAQTALKASGASGSEPNVSKPDSVKKIEEMLERKLGALVPAQPSAAAARHSSPELKSENADPQPQRQDKELLAALAKIESLQSDLAISLRLQQQAQNDMFELRARYRENEKDRVTQSALLQKLTPRLQQAAQQLQQLSLTEDLPAALAIEVADPPSKTRTTRSRKSPTKPTTKAKTKTSTRKRTPATKQSTGSS